MSAPASWADRTSSNVPEPSRIRSVAPELVERVVECLVSPFAYADRDTWLLACTDAFARAAGADEAAAYIDGPEASGIRILSKDLPPWVIPLLPALGAGLDAWDRLSAAQQALGSAFDQLESGLALYDMWKQRRVAMNRTLARLLDADSELLLADLDAFARDLAAPTKSRSLRFTVNGNGPRRVIRTARGAYRVSPVTLPEAMVTRAGAVGVLVSRVDPVVPSATKLIGVAGLTRREAEVAHQVALGWSNPEIAVRLNLSLHTVRHHVEHVFRKLDVSTRREVVERISSAEWLCGASGQ